ncbi:excinuclease ABC subunit UvrA [Schaalia sp. 19OD2882]|uniref:ATP-binding cassette domain-containing protein n=1 Tax=Schaalia sp. 19OD2882 TaxID=2794089 RepID=UPI001C1EB7D6|nr:excinuclease ABC subunit UvrA [Schaalia sp. 19OD2882]QWW19078.1 excinuclease ABC subunit UvrA [Schaalia sp. 19OD2882]
MRPADHAPTPTSSSDNLDVIRVRGARENNLRDVDVDVPKRALTVFTGVSGSGKSSLVFDTIAAESERLLNETHSAFVQGFLRTPPRPDTDELTGLTASVTVNQDPMGANPRSTVGTATDVDAKLRVLFARLATPHIGGPQAFSFNVPSVSGAGAVTVTKGERTVAQKKSFSVVGGMCPRCEGRGEVSDLDMGEVVDMNLSIDEGAILVPGYKVGGWSVRQFSECGLFPSGVPVRTFSKRQLETFLYGEPTKVVISDINMTYEGLVPRLRKSILSKDVDSLQSHLRAWVQRAATFTTCPDCQGTRLAEGARTSTIRGRSIADLCAMEVRDLVEWVADLDEPSLAPLLKGLVEDLRAMVDVGLGYLSLSRATGTLSGGEAQRIRMVRHLGSALSDVTYVFDEPTTGLHPHDVARMNELLLGLRDKGNTVLVVEHDPETIRLADHVIDMGPGAGAAGGTVVYEGDVAGLVHADTPTGRHMADRGRLKDEGAVRACTGVIEIRGAATHNLRNVDVDLPLGLLCVVTGVAGSGKSSLVPGSLPKGCGALVVDQSPIKGSSRSNPATWTGMLEPIRKAFAKANGVKPALFSANSEGACQNCNGSGFIRTELGFMETVTTTCEVCEGRRFDDSVRQYLLGGLDIVEVLALSAQDAANLFAAPDSKVPAARKICEAMVAVGLGYLGIGQALTTLSGGERQRLKLAAHLLDEDAKVLVLDEPTTGLHVQDVDRLLELLDRLVDAGKSVIVVEHNLAVMAHADWIIDIGPGAGSDGGRIVFEGTPSALVAVSRAGKGTVTGTHLAAHVTPCGVKWCR